VFRNRGQKYLSAPSFILFPGSPEIYTETKCKPDLSNYSLVNNTGIIVTNYARNFPKDLAWEIFSYNKSAVEHFQHMHLKSVIPERERCVYETKAPR